jgi:DMSO/TMAO reductase YedYZ molybdopterin-dependent catalytic subunit
MVTGVLVAAGVALAAGLAALEILVRVGRLRAPRPVATSVPTPAVTMVDRRRFLGVGAAVAALAAATAVTGRAIANRLSTAAARAAVLLPKPKKAAVAPDPDASFAEQEAASPLVTPNADFYRIDTALAVPNVDPDSWRLGVTGMVDKPFEISFQDLLAMDMVEEWVTICCVSNEVGGNLIGNARWQGVPLATLLERAGVESGASQVVGRSVDGFTVGFPTEVALDGRVAMVAIGMNGEPLPLRHGFPARLIVAGLYGYVSATKWLREIELTTLDAFDAYWIPRGWSKEAPIKTQSRIDVLRPAGGGSYVIAGVAWAPTRGVAKVEVQVDGGAWTEATLASELTSDTWRQWRWDWDTPAAGRHEVKVRATDGTGAVQTADSAPPPPDGATGYHTRSIDVP